tara:strand:- start:863 stop:2101 length:1239 start_codon:yes stop_codon:yes gene_type:complete
MIDKIINEWTYQLDAGYPTKDSDYEVLRSVLQETDILSEQEINRTIQQAKGLYEQDPEQETTSVESVLTNELKLPPDIVRQVLSIYDNLSPAEQTLFNNNFRTHTIESFVSNGWTAFKEFFLVNIGGARGGMGNGEISVLLGVKGSEPGGTSKHDIVMPNGEWEVKELKSNKFDPAKAGLATKFELTTKIKDFYKDIVNTVSNIGDPYESLKHLVDKESAEDLKKLIRIFETRFEAAIDPDKLASFEWKKSAMHNWYEGFKELHDIFYKTKLDTDVKDTRLTVNTDGNKKSYWISDDDVEQIELSSGEETRAAIDIGDPVDNINTNVVIWFNRLERHEFVKNPQNFLFNLNQVKNDFFAGILGLIYYNYRNPQPYIGLSTNFAIDVVSQGRYRFVQKDAPSSQGYDYLQGQG